MSKYIVTLDPGEVVHDGMTKYIKCPCDCYGVTDVILKNAEGGVIGTFSLCDATGKNTSDVGDVWSAGHYIQVLFNFSAMKAQVLNGANPRTRIVEVLATLAANKWTGSAAPYTQQVTIEGMAADTPGIARVNYQTATLAQRNAARNAMLCLTEQGANTVTITADGTLPTEDIPIVVRMDIKLV